MYTTTTPTIPSVVYLRTLTSYYKIVPRKIVIVSLDGSDASIIVRANFNDNPKEVSVPEHFKDLTEEEFETRLSVVQKIINDYLSNEIIASEKGYWERLMGKSFF